MARRVFDLCGAGFDAGLHLLGGTFGACHCGVDLLAGGLIAVATRAEPACQQEGDGACQGAFVMQLHVLSFRCEIAAIKEPIAVMAI